MKKLFLYAFIVFLSIFVFNINVDANELDTDDNLDINVSDVLNVESEEEILDEEIVVQHTRVNISKVNEKGEPVVGAKLQVIDSFGNIVYEWVSDGSVYETMLPAGKYILHEVMAPEGYQLAEDKEFEVDVILDEEIIGDAEMNGFPCDHGDDNRTPLYFVEINSVSYEVYCINQGLATPNGINYNGQIVKPEELREFTKQETNIDTDGFTVSGSRLNVNTETVLDYDVSDQTLTDQELYDKVLDIIYHRYLAEKDSRFSSLTVAEIRFITEIALKNYLNAGITTYETVRILNGTKIVHVSFNKDGEIWQEGDGTKYIKLYNKFYNREYLYDVNSPTGYIISSGNGDSFGNFAKHWYAYHGNVQVPAIYAELFYYLISDENKHLDSMQLFMYSPTMFLSDSPYQNLLGITGFIEDADTKEQSVEMVNKYSDEKRDITVSKVWEDKLFGNDKRPNSITVNLYADGKLIDSIELNDNNNWTYVFKGLDMYKEGKKIIYTIEEVKVFGYETKVKGDMDSGFTIVNTYYDDLKLDDDKKEFLVNPYTGDNIYKFILLLIISSLGLCVTPLCIKFN